MKIENQSLEYSLLQLPWSHTIAIVSPGALETMDDDSKSVLENYHSRVISTVDTGYDDILDRTPHDLTTVVSVGDDTAINLSKHLSISRHSYHIVIPQSLATSNFVTVKPDEVRVDYGYIRKSSDNLYGVVELLTLHTFLKDWRLYQAHLTSIHEYRDVIDDTYHTAVNCLNETLELSYDFLKINELNLSRLFNLLCRSGDISYGPGSVKSYGKELKELMELREVIEIPYGLSCLIGMYIMEYFYHMNSYLLNGWNLKNFSEIHMIFMKLGMIDKFNSFEIPYDFLYDVLKGLRGTGSYSLIDKLPGIYDIITIHDGDSTEENDYDYCMLAEFLNSKGIKTF